MRGNAGRTTVNLHGAICNFQVNAFPGVLIRAGVPIVFKDYIIVNVYLPAIDPCGNLIRDRRQWMEERLLVLVSVISAPFAFPEVFMVESVEFFATAAFKSSRL